MCLIFLRPQPYARVDYIPQSGTENLITRVMLWNGRFGGFEFKCKAELVLLNVYRAPELMPRNEFRQPL